jgi:hypothetical protein
MDIRDSVAGEVDSEAVSREEERSRRFLIPVRSSYPRYYI